MHVRRSVKNDLDGRWITGPPKSHQARAVALDTFTLAILHQHRVRADGWARHAAVSIGLDGYILTFDPSGGQPIRPDSLGQAFGRLCRRLHLDGVTLHSLRHFSAGMLITGGRDVRTVAGRLGHADASTTLRAYAQMVEGRDQDAADFLGQLMSTAQAAAVELRG